MGETMRLCFFEEQEFPESEFHHDPLHGWVHDTDPPHTTTGDAIDANGGEPFPDAIPGEEVPPIDRALPDGRVLEEPA